MSIVVNEFGGADGYNVGYIGTQVSGDALARWKKGDCPLAALKGRPAPGGNPEILVDVQPGVPFLYGSVSTTTGTFPTGTQVTVTDPNGNVLQAGDTPGSIVYFNGNSVQSFIISNPTPGTWKLVAIIPGADDADVYILMSTIPTGDQVYQTMIEAIEQQLDKDAIGAAQTDNSLGCWACTICMWALIVAIAAIVAVGIFAITLPASLPAVTALALAIGVSATVMTGLLVALLTAVGAVVGIVVANLCNWVNACENDLTVSIGTPTDKSTESGTFKIAANTSGASSVSFTLDSSDLGNVTAGPPYKYLCDSTKFPNGAHTIYALAISGEETALSAPVRVTFSN
jgi:hypothetical protein